jgi:hypothetical protein
VPAAVNAEGVPMEPRPFPLRETLKAHMKTYLKDEASAPGHEGPDHSGNYICYFRLTKVSEPPINHGSFRLKVHVRQVQTALTPVSEDRVQDATNTSAAIPASDLHVPAEEQSSTTATSTSELHVPAEKQSSVPAAGGEDDDIPGIQPRRPKPLASKTAREVSDIHQLQEFAKCGRVNLKKKPLNKFGQHMANDPLLARFIDGKADSPWMQRLKRRGEGKPLGDYEPGFEGVSLKKIWKEMKAEARAGGEVNADLVGGEVEKPKKRKKKKSKKSKKVGEVKKEEEAEE